MKLGDMKADRLLDTLTALTGPLCELAEDAAVQEAVEALLAQDLTGMKPVQAWGALVSTLVPLLLVRRRETVLKAAAVLLDRTVAEIRGMNGVALVAQLQECMDEALMDFFCSAAGMEGNGCSLCSAAEEEE